MAHDAASAPPRRLGVIVPSSNTVVEALLPRLLPRDGSVTAHVARLPVQRISDDAASLAQFELERLCAAAESLADAAVDHLLWNGTAASWLGQNWDAALMAEIEQRTGIATTTAVCAVDAKLTEAGARRIGLVTPYVSSLEQRIVANYATRGIEVVKCDRLDLVVNTDYAKVRHETITDMIRRVAAPRVEAVVIMCTNLPGAEAAADLSAELRLPVIDSARAAIDYGVARLLPSTH